MPRRTTQPGQGRPAPPVTRPLPRPKLTSGGLKELQLILVQRIGELEELFESGWPLGAVKPRDPAIAAPPPAPARYNRSLITPARKAKTNQAPRPSAMPRPSPNTTGDCSGLANPTFTAIKIPIIMPTLKHPTNKVLARCRAPARFSAARLRFYPAQRAHSP